MNAYIKMVNE